MKKLFNLTVIGIFVSVIYWACKKDSNNSSGNNLTSAQQQLIANAKTYFENNVRLKVGNDKACNRYHTAGGAQFNAVKSLIKNAVWSAAYVQTISIGKIVVVPIHFSSSLYVYTNYTDSTLRLPINKLSRLIVYSDSLKQLHAEVVTEFPDDNFIKNSTSSFSGIALVQDWQGNYLRGYQYSASGIKKLVFSSAANAGDKTTNSAVAPDVTPAPPTETCYESYVTTCVSTADNSQQYCTTTTQELGCISDPSGTDDGGNSTPSGGDYGGIAGGGSGSSSISIAGLSASPVACASFVFKNNGTTLNYQEAGVSGLFYDVRAGGQIIQNFNFRTIYVGVPLKLKNGQVISAGVAAEQAANAATIAGEQLQGQYSNTVPSPSTQMDAQFASLMQTALSGLIGAQCNVYFRPTLSTTVVTPVVWMGQPGSGGRCATSDPQ